MRKDSQLTTQRDQMLELPDKDFKKQPQKWFNNQTLLKQTET